MSKSRRIILTYVKANLLRHVLAKCFGSEILWISSMNFCLFSLFCYSLCFFHGLREHVKTALIDLYLFLEMAGINNVNMVMKPESLEPIVIELLWRKETLAKPDVNRAEIAKLFIMGF